MLECCYCSSSLWFLVKDFSFMKQSWFLSLVKQLSVGSLLVFLKNVFDINSLKLINFLLNRLIQLIILHRSFWTCKWDIWLRSFKFHHWVMFSWHSTLLLSDCLFFLSQEINHQLFIHDPFRALISDQVNKFSLGWWLGFSW